jgi:hypothetical protein
MHELEDPSSIHALPMGRRKLVVPQFFVLGQDYEPGDKPDLQSLTGTNDSFYKINEGQYLLLRIHNLSKQVLGMTAHDLQPGWTVEQIFPRREASNTESVEPECYEDVILRAYLPQGNQEGKDALKAFVKVEPTIFRWLGPPFLDKLLERRRENEPESQLEQFMDIITEDKPKTCDLEPSVSASHERTTSQGEIEVKCF